MRQRWPIKSGSTSKLFAYWNERRGSRLAPERGDIEPGAIRNVLGDSFIIAFDPEACHPFRLAGRRVCALCGRELKGEAFVQLWDRETPTARRETTKVGPPVPVATGAGAR